MLKNEKGFNCFCEVDVDFCFKQDLICSNIVFGRIFKCGRGVLFYFRRKRQ